MDYTNSIVNVLIVFPFDELKTKHLIEKQKRWFYLLGNRYNKVIP